jgi:hypothetical protein
MTRLISTVLIIVGAALGANTSGVRCTTELAPTAIRGLPEASGAAVSRRTPGTIWSMNDSGEPLLFAVDASGAITGRVRVTGATVNDWEDLSIGPCGQGSCLYIADIGDNRMSRRTISVYRVPEPRVDEDATAPAEVFVAAYPDGAHDAEAMFVDGSGRAYIVTKDKPAATMLYRFPSPLRTGTTMMLERVANLPLGHVTDADASADGSWVALRTHREVVFYATQELLSQRSAKPLRVDLTGLREPQGEGVAFGSNGLLYLTGEGGGSGTGTFAVLRCSLPKT